MSAHPLIGVAADDADVVAVAPTPPQVRIALGGLLLCGLLICVWTFVTPHGIGPARPRDIATWFATAVVCGGGVLLFLRAGQDAAFRKPMGISLILSGLCHLASNHWGADTPIAQAAILIGAGASLLLCLAGVSTRVPRPQHLMTVRGFLEAALMGTVMSVALWQFGFRLLGAPSSVVPGLLFSTVIVCGALHFALRSEDRGLRIGAVALGFLLLAAIASFQLQQDLFPGVDDLRMRMATGALLWPPTVLGIFLSRPGRVEADSDWFAASERRSTLTMSVVVLTFTGIALFGMWKSGVDTPSLLLMGLALLILWLREIVRATQHHHLLTEVSAQAATDPMTGLPNRRGLEQKLGRLASHPEANLAMITVDIDRFKDINDLLGRTRGDALLSATANTLQQIAGEAGGQAYRVDGDEFVLLVSGGRDEARAVAAQAVDVMTSAAVRVPGAARLQLSCSVGVDGTWSRDAHDDLAGVLSRSGHAMRHAKTNGSRAAIFSSEMASALARRQAVEHRLRVDLDAIQVHFQPIVELTRHRVVAVEALARWHDPFLGEIPPAEFVTVAEDCGLMERLGQHLRHTALEQAAELSLADDGIRVTVNVSVLELRVPGFAERVLDDVGAVGMNPQDLILEVSESLLRNRAEPAVRTLHQLSEMGIGIVLDDFGAGYSSLALLTGLPVQGLKMARSLTGRLPDARADAVASVLGRLATDLGLTVMAAGVETAEQERALCRHGLCLVQGWRYAEALDLSALEGFLLQTRR